MRPNRRRRIQAAHLRHLHVHQDDVDLPRRGRGHRRDTVVDDGDDVAVAPEQPGRQRLIDLIVFGEQDPQRVFSHGSGPAPPRSLHVRRGAASGMAVAKPKGAMNENVLPLPASLSTQSRPPIRFTIRTEMLRPRPVPPYLRVVEPSA